MNTSSQAQVHVGILHAGEIRFQLHGQCSGEGRLWPEGEYLVRREGTELLLKHEAELCFTGPSLFLHATQQGPGNFSIHDVRIGIGFHWEQSEQQRFSGSLKLMVLDKGIQAINVLPVEAYLGSVISSEMRGDNDPELLKAHAVISRSWLLAQMDRQESASSSSRKASTLMESKDEYLRWYDREDHSHFHVCADDHCQRYQGTGRSSNPEVLKAIEETHGEVIAYQGSICDARYSKCCGGVTEVFEHCWEAVHHPYLLRIDDRPGAQTGHGTDLKEEAAASAFIRSSPEAFCNTRDRDLLERVLNDYDQASSDFFRWELSHRQDELAALIRRKSGRDFGHILDLIPVERGESGRLVRLRIVGTRASLTVGKELEIRRWLSDSHLYSSAFVVEKTGQEGSDIPSSFTLKGAGWGHGVGLCQIGAAVMAHQGYSYREILAHYFRNTRIERI